MQPRFWRNALFLFALCALVVWRSPTAAQGATQNTDVLGALLTEVRGLRVAMEQMASAGPRVQLAMGRLQLQEQRINSMIRQLDAVREQLAGKQGKERELGQQITSLEEYLASGKEDPRRKAIELDELPELKRQLQLIGPEIQRLQTEEASLSQQVATEQGRWNDINHSLEELERALARKP